MLLGCFGNRFQGLAACIMLAAAGASPAAVLVDFNGSSGLEKFNIPSGNTFTYQTTGNIIGDSAIKPANDGRATYNQSTFGLAVNQSISTSMKFTKTSPTGASVPIVQLGFGDVSIDTFNNAATGYNTIYARALVVDSAAATYKLVSDNKLTTNTVASETSPNGSGTFIIANPGGNSFYKFSVTLTRTDTNTFTQSAMLELLDATDKNTPLSTISSFSPQTITNAGMATAADAGLMYAGFRGVVAAGVLRMEDFAVSDVTSVPEPTAAASLIAVGGLLLRRRR